MLTYAYLCLLMLDTHFYSCLHMVTRLFLFLPCLPILTRVFLCLPIFSHVHLCLPLFTCVFVPMLPHLYCLHTFTHVYSSPMFTHVCTSLHMFALATYASNYLLVINCLFVLDNLFLPMFTRVYLWLLLFTYVYHCLLVSTYVYPYFLIFTYVHSYLLVFITSLVFTFSVLGNLC